MARPLNMICRAAGTTWPDLSNQHIAMTANLMMDIMSSNSDREVSSCDFCAVSTACRVFSAVLVLYYYWGQAACQ